MGRKKRKKYVRLDLFTEQAPVQNVRNVQSKVNVNGK